MNVGYIPKEIIFYAAHVEDTLRNYVAHYGFKGGVDVVNVFNWPKLKKMRDLYVVSLNYTYKRRLDVARKNVIRGDVAFVDAHMISV